MKRVQGFPYYEVRSDGTIYSRPRTIKTTYRGKPITRKMKGKVLKARPDLDGYLSVTLYRVDGTTKQFRVHVLVARHFIGPRPKGMQIDHIDRNKANNAAKNLRYTTPSENNLNTDLRDKTKGYYWCKRRSRWIAQIYRNGKRTRIGSFKLEKDAEEAYQAAKQQPPVV